MSAMDFLRFAEVGDVFQWRHPYSPHDYCEIIAIDGLRIDFRYLTGLSAGQRAHTILPQNVEHITDTITLLSLLV